MPEALAYYNENDETAAAWLRELIKAGEIAYGFVDERDIRDVRPDELFEYTQCHFFAGIGGWSLALKRAGWPDDKPVWTGSCPCQPFSAAGRGEGVDDERHLWPHWFHLISQCQPPIVFGEQVASKDGLGWFDLVQFDLEAAQYAVGAADLCAAGLGAPHIRQRLWFVAESLADAGIERQPGPGELGQPSYSKKVEDREIGGTVNAGGRVRMADSECESLGRRGLHRPSESYEAAGARASGEPVGNGAIRNNGRTSPLDGFWKDADWLHCRDGKWRPVEPASQRMAHGVSIAMDDCIHEVKIDAEASERITAEALRAMRRGHDPEAIWLEVGGCVGFPAATVLLAILCKHAGQLGGISDRLPSESAAGRVERCLRALWIKHGSFARPPSGRGFSKQLAGELGDALPKLPQKGSPHWSALGALTGGPLAHGVSGRVGLLRGYGNAIVPEVAQAFIEAYMEVKCFT